MTDADSSDNVGIFLETANVVHAAIADEVVAAAWERPSVLEEQRVSNLCGHLARGIWVVGEYLAAGPPAGPPDFNSAAEYFSLLSDRATEEFHRANRQREATLVPDGHGELVSMLGDRLAGLDVVLRSGAPDRRVAVFSGLVIRLDHYLATRIVEQVVHLDDLARSVGHDLWPTPQCDALVVAIGAEIGLRRRGPTAMVRALYRQGFTEGIFPVL
jgi:hypothetical protein